MDNLARNAMLARQAGMSYGKWKAMQEPVKVENKPIPKGWKKCEGCGKVFKPNDVRQRFCDVTCRTETYNAAHREEIKLYARLYKRNRRAKKGGCDD